MGRISRRSFLKGAGISALATVLSACQQEDIPMLSLVDEIGEPGTQIAIIEGCPWGPAVRGTILCLPQAVKSSSVSADKFTVIESKEVFDPDTSRHMLASAPRTVVEAVTVTPDGRVTKLSSRYILLTFRIQPDVGCPLCYDPLTGQSTRCDPYQLKIFLNAPLKTLAGGPMTGLAIDPNVSLAAPCLKNVDLNGVFTGPEGHTFCYASYQPQHPAGEKHPLVVWLHGAGEGGEDPAVVLLGNQVSSLFSDAFQSVMGGAYILAPQTPTFWMCYNENGDWSDNPGVSSVYREDLMALIQNYVAQNPGIDPDRIILGGCSNGGYMTMDLVMHHPGYFAAAYPICEAYLDAGITDEELHTIADTRLPIWFVYARNDTTVPPQLYAAPTMARLAAMDADLYSTVWPSVTDATGRLTGPDGEPYQYNGHCSWIYFFQGLCKDDATGADLWTWMSRQHRTI